MPCVAARHGHCVARYVGPCGLFLDQTAIQRPFNGHLTKISGEQVASLVTLLIQAKKSPAAVGMPACQLHLCPLGLVPSNICENSTKLACFGLFLATKGRYVGYVANPPFMLLYVNHGIELSHGPPLARQAMRPGLHHWISWV